MTTETPKPRTLLEPVAYRCMMRLPAAARFAENARPAIDDALAEAYALGAASRASPEEGRLREEDKARERLLYGVMWQAREVLSRCNLDGSANLNRKETAALRNAVRDFDREDERLHDAALRSSPTTSTAPTRSPTKPADPSPESGTACGAHEEGWADFACTLPKGHDGEHEWKGKVRLRSLDLSAPVPGATTGGDAPLGGIVLGIAAEPAPLPCGCRGLCDGSCGSGRSPSPNTKEK